MMQMTYESGPVIDMVRNCGRRAVRGMLVEMREVGTQRQSGVVDRIPSRCDVQENEL